MIAATYTPFMVYIDNIVMLSIIWTIALTNVIEMIYYKTISKLSLLKYLIMGWGVMFTFPQLYYQLNSTSLYFLIGGGLAYTAGVYFFVKDRAHKYYHSIWHIFTALATFLHYFAVYYIYN
jgi:hemolysin III